MNCPDFDTLMMLLDGELPSARMKEVSEHVRLCSRCRNLIDSQRKLETSWRDSFTAPKEDDFRSMEWIIYRRMNRRSRWKFFVPAAAGIIAVLLGVKLIMENQPFKGRITESSIDRQTDYESYVLHLEDTRDDSAASDGDGFESAETLSTEDTTRETAAEVSDDVAGSARYEAPHSAAEGIDQQSVTGGEAAGGGSRGIVSSVPGADEEERDEAEVSEETVSTGAVESICPEEQLDDISCIIPSPDSDTAGICGDTGNIGELNQSSDSISRSLGILDSDTCTSKSDTYVELVFDEAGQPDSSTALLLDSLFADWNDYIPIMYRDTVLVVPMAGIQELFEEGSIIPAETIE